MIEATFTLAPVTWPFILDTGVKEEGREGIKKRKKEEDEAQVTPTTA